MPAAPFTPAAVAKLRADTLGCAEQLFFNNAGSSLPPRAVVERVIEHLRLEERLGGYEAEAAVQDELT
jgi:cysteine desulfurase / selenocysteine lyase